ncbi:MAG TPA: hypothetical protein VEF05_11560 [Terriglobales bacterium]|nr:hypothetical protein [Terriglobales bacterium]
MTAGRIRNYAALLASRARQNPATASALARGLVDKEYDHVSETKLISQAKTILRAARLTAFTVTTKAEAVAVIRGLQPSALRTGRP